MAEGVKEPLTDLPTWMVDPIDGTSNFIHSFPFSAVSIGLTVNKQPVVGVVYNFNLDQMFAARKGGGATMNGKPIESSNCSGNCKLRIDPSSPVLGALNFWSACPRTEAALSVGAI